jgi:transposase InsO family protein
MTPAGWPSRPYTRTRRQLPCCTSCNAAPTFYKRYGIDSKAVLTDNGNSYRSDAFADKCRELGLKHRRNRPYTPRTDGKAEQRLIGTTC